MLPLRRYTPPGTRETALRRPVSWLAVPAAAVAAISRAPPSRARAGAMAWGALSPPTVAGAAAAWAWRVPCVRVPVSALAGHRRMPDW